MNRSIYTHPDGPKLEYVYGELTAVDADGNKVALPIGPAGLADLAKELAGLANNLALVQAAIKFSRAAADTAKYRKLLDSAYSAWRESSGNWGVMIIRNDANWLLMMQATADEYRQLRNAKSREYRARQKLLALADEAEGQ
jgi:hypothetical protein